MFRVYTITDSFTLPPNCLDKQQTAITERVNKKYHDKLIPKVGYCVQVKDISHNANSDVEVLQGDGSIRMRINIDLIVFRPDKGLVLTGTLK